MSRLGASIDKRPIHFWVSGCIFAPVLGGLFFGLLALISSLNDRGGTGTPFIETLAIIPTGALMFGIFGFIFGVVPGLISTIALFVLRRKNITMPKVLPIIFVSTYIPWSLFIQSWSGSIYFGILACIAASMTWLFWIAMGWAETNE